MFLVCFFFFLNSVFQTLHPRYHIPVHLDTTWHNLSTSWLLTHCPLMTHFSNGEFCGLHRIHTLTRPRWQYRDVRHLGGDKIIRAWVIRSLAPLQKWSWRASPFCHVKVQPEVYDSAESLPWWCCTKLDLGSPALELWKIIYVVYKLPSLW